MPTMVMLVSPVRRSVRDGEVGAGGEVAAREVAVLRASPGQMLRTNSRATHLPLLPPLRSCIQ